MDADVKKCSSCGHLWDPTDITEGRCRQSQCGGTCAEAFGSYADACPRCGGPIKLTSCSVVTEAPVSRDGWDLGATRFMNTSGERFICRRCHSEVPASWVLGQVTRAEVLDLMETKEFVVELATKRHTHAKVVVRARTEPEAEAEIRRRFFGEAAIESLGDLDWKPGDLDDDVIVIGVSRAAR